MGNKNGWKNRTILSPNPLRGNQLRGISELRHAKIAGSTNFSIMECPTGVFVGVAHLALEGTEIRRQRSSGPHALRPVAVLAMMSFCQSGLRL